MRHDNAALSHAIDALSLVQLGTTYGNSDMLQESLRAYGQSLHRLSLDMTSPRLVQTEHILTAITVLIRCGCYQLYQVTGNPYVSHINGLRVCLQAYVLTGAKSKVSHRLFGLFRVAEIAHAVYNRKAIEETKRRKLLLHDEAVPTSNCLGLELAELLEGVDTLQSRLRSSCNQAHKLTLLADDLLHRCSELENQLRQNLSRAHGGKDSTYDTKPMDRYHMYTVLGTKCLLDEAHSFQGFTSAFLWMQFWLRAFLVREAQASLLRYRQELEGCNATAENSPILEADRQVHVHVMELCRCMPYFAEPENGVFGNLCCLLPLQYISKYFTSKGAKEWISWTEDIQRDVFCNGLRHPDIVYHRQ